MKQVVCGIDSSTQSCTLVLRDPDTGKILGFSQSPHPKTYPPKSEQAPSSWWDAVGLSLKKLDREYSIGALSIGGQGHGSVLLDSENHVLRNAKLWNNTETVQESSDLINMIGLEKWIELTSIVPVPAFTITKLLWIKRNESQIYKKSRKILLPHDWLNFKLSGNFVTDRSEATGTGYFSPAMDEWKYELLNLVDNEKEWKSMLPRVAGPDDIIGRVHKGAAEELGLVKGIPIAPGCNDNSASALGLGMKTSDVCISLGTSGTVFVASQKPVFDKSGYINGNADATGAFLPLSCSLNAAKVTDWIINILGVDFKTADQMALSAPATPNRPLVIPYFDGERTPNLPNASGSIVGLRTNTTPEQLMRGFFEGVLLGLTVSGLDSIKKLGIDTSGRLILTGGGAASPAYTQFLADISSSPVWISQETRSAALGAAVQAAAVFHNCKVTEIRDQWAPELSIAAEPRKGQAVEEIVARYKELVKQEEKL